MSQFETISLDELTRTLQSGTVVQFWNVLTDDYFTGELIPGSRRVPLGTVGREAHGLGLARDTPIITYCSGPTCPQSGQAAAKLARLGFTNVRAFEGGVAVWKEAGRPVEREAARLATA